MERIFAEGMRLFPQPVDGERGEAKAPVLQPIYLFADSQMLFWRESGLLFLETLRLRITRTTPRAAYVGASNGDNPDYFSIFVAAMEGIGITRCRAIPTEPSPEDRSFLDDADIILLAGGGVQRGWDAFTLNGLRETLVRRYREGAVLVGVSAGAVQLGLLGWPEGDTRAGSLFGTFGLVPFVVGAHDEANDWEELRRVVAMRGGSVQGIGLPRGGAAVYYPGMQLEAVRHPVYEFVAREDGVIGSVILPPEETSRA